MPFRWKHDSFGADQVRYDAEKGQVSHQIDMRYQFNEFEFDSTSLLLTRDGAALAIRHTEAKVLALLLEHADSVLSKEEILSHAWRGKIVSEQVVFQNISNLRSLFGNDAIKTFPKRGYQWQLGTGTRPAAGNRHSSNTTEPLPPKRSLWQLAALTCLFAVALTMVLSQQHFMQDDKNSVIKLAYIPITNLEAPTSVRHESLFLEDNSEFDFTLLPQLDTEQFEDAMEIEYPKLSATHPFILTGILRTHQQQSYLEFTLKGPVSEWRGQLSGPTPQALVEQLLEHLRQDVIYDVIGTLQPPELHKAKLAIAHQASPDDLIILRHLGIAYLRTNELDKAMATADKLINRAQAQNNPQHVGRALLYQSNLLEQRKLYDLSSQKLALAMQHFEKIGDLKHLAKAWRIQSWLDHGQNNYPAVKASLLKSARLAFDAKDKFRELEALTYLSLMAHDYQENDDKYLYLRKAENKMKAYGLPVYHFSKIPFHYAIFAEDPAEKESHLKQVLEFTSLTPEHRVAQSSRKQLMQLYINQNRLAEAQALIGPLSADNYNNSYLRTLLAQAKQQTQDMLNHAQRTFEQAQLAGNRALSLDVAVLLCSYKVNCDFYAQFISDNATPRWRESNREKLLALQP